MAYFVKDRVCEFSTTGGTGALTLMGAFNSNYRSAAAAGIANGDNMPYIIEDPVNGGFETGFGTWGTGSILTRAVVQSSSNAGAAVNWTAGARLMITIGLTEAAFATKADLSYAVTKADRTRPSFSATQTTATLMPANGNTKIYFQSVDLDTHGGYNSGNSRYTASVAGWYHVMGNVNMTTAANACLMMCWKNGSEARRGSQGSVDYACGISALVYLGVGDYIEIYVFMNAADQNTAVGATFWQATMVIG